MHEPEEVDVLLQTQDDLVPIYHSPGAAGADVRAAIAEPLMLQPGHSLLVPTGLFLQIPEGYEVQVRPRSGLALKHQITVLNSPGTIDSDYRGEVGIILINHGRSDFVIEPGMRIAQIVLAKVTRARFMRQEKLSATQRGQNGFGHSGVE